MTLPQKTAVLLGTWSQPPDLPAKIALGLAALVAIAALFGRGRSLLFGHDDGTAEERRVDRRRFLAIFGIAAGLFSIAYVSIYLRGGPRIVDATTYFLQGRALAQGDLAWTPLEPSASFRGRFLLYREEGPDAPSLGGIFPPGYPLLLAFGFMLGAPMIAGPLLAVGLVVATYRLAKALAKDALPALAEPIARAAALLSLFSAALRYHTADTMSHGAAALGITVALDCAIRARQARTGKRTLRREDQSPFDGGRGEALLAGLAIGYVVATRPVSAMPIAIVVAWLLRPARHHAPAEKDDAPRSRLGLLALLGMVPGVFLLLLSQRAVTGSWIESTQRMYYAISDGPSGCFRWGFGQGAGCLFEHGEHVDARLRGGYGLLEAAMTTLRRLRHHLLDVANLEPLALLVVVPALLRGRLAKTATGILPATALVGLQILAYAPFYFDGDYPGGGARFFADVLPVEHALAALAIAMLAARARAVDRAFTRGAFAVFALALAGFGIHASYEHGKLRDRDGGRPMFEPDVLARASLTSGLVFVDTDHGFALGHDPHARPSDRVLVARLRNDDRDRMLFESLGRPPTWRYDLEAPVPPSVEHTPKLTPWAPPESGDRLRIEAEAEWPALEQEHGFAAPAWTDGCASGSRALVVTPEPGQRAKVTIELPVPSAGRWAVEVSTVNGASVPFAPKPSAVAEGALAIGAERWTWKADGDTCKTLPVKELDLAPPHAIVTIEASGGPIAIDYVAIRKVR